MKKYSLPKRYQAVIERDEDGWYIGYVPAIPGCHTQAKTLEDLRDRLKEVIQLCLEQAAGDPKYRSLIEADDDKPAFVGLETVKV